MLFADRLGRIPRRQMLFSDDRRRTVGCIPALAADADRVRDDAVAPAFGEVIEPVLGHVEHDSAVRRIGQDIARRNNDLGALSRQPGIDIRIGALELLGADVIAPGQIDEGIFMGGFDDLNLADDVATGFDSVFLCVDGTGSQNQH